jgi:hypothetical protein
MDIGTFILIINFVVIVSVEIISYLINSEITKTKQKRNYSFPNSIKSTIYRCYSNNVSTNSKDIGNSKNNISNKSGFNRTKINNVI